MARTPKEYAPISGRGMRLEGRFTAYSRTFCRLWVGTDHLLLADMTGYTETYKRFYFKDIQAVIIRKTIKGAVVTLIMSLLASPFILGAVTSTNVGARIALGFWGGLFGLIALINFLMGPTCVTHIKTPVQLEQLPPWNRVKSARKGLNRIRQKLLEAQGTYFPDDIKAELSARLQRVSQSPPA